MNSSKPTQGWAVPPACLEAHYFVSGSAICGYPFDFAGPVEDDKHDHPDNCYLCMRKRLEREAAGGAK